MADWLALHARPDAWVVMEATGIHHEALAVSVDGWGYRVCVVNPAQVAAYARSEFSRTKTDRTDANLIMRFAQGHAERLRRWQPERLRGQVRVRYSQRARFSITNSTLQTTATTPMRMK